MFYRSLLVSLKCQQFLQGNTFVSVILSLARLLVLWGKWCFWDFWSTRNYTSNV